MRTKLIFGLALLVSVVPSAYAGTLEGTVTYEGEVPPLPVIRMDADADCMAKHKEPPKSDFLVLGSGNTMGNILVNVKNAPAGGAPAKPAPAIIDQNGCQYHPHVLALMAGQELKFRNSDGILHNVNVKPNANRGFNLAMPGTMTESDDKGFAKSEPEPFRVKCDVHPWMTAWVQVFDNPYHSVTEADGKYKIENLPAGEYEISAWQEKLGARTAKVTVPAEGSATLDIKFTREKK